MQNSREVFINVCDSPNTEALCRAEEFALFCQLKRQKECVDCAQIVDEAAVQCDIYTGLKISG